MSEEESPAGEQPNSPAEEKPQLDSAIPITVNFDSLQKLFEDLCWNMIKMQKDLTVVQVQMAQKVDRNDYKSDIDRINRTMTQDSQRLSNFGSVINDLRETIKQQQLSSRVSARTTTPTQNIPKPNTPEEQDPLASLPISDGIQPETHQPVVDKIVVPTNEEEQKASAPHSSQNERRPAIQLSSGREYNLPEEHATIIISNPNLDVHTKTPVEQFRTIDPQITPISGSDSVAARLENLEFQIQGMHQEISYINDEVRTNKDATVKIQEDTANFRDTDSQLIERLKILEEQLEAIRLNPVIKEKIIKEQIKPNTPIQKSQKPPVPINIPSAPLESQTPVDTAKSTSKSEIQSETNNNISDNGTEDQPEDEPAATRSKAATANSPNRSSPIQVEEETAAKTTRPLPSTFEGYENDDLFSSRNKDIDEAVRRAKDVDAKTDKMMELMQKLQNTVPADASAMFQQFMEAARYEIDTTAKKVADESSAKIRKLQTRIRELAEDSAQLQESLNGRLDKQASEVMKKVAQEMQKTNNNTSTLIGDLKEQEFLLRERLRLIEDRVKSQSAASILGKPIDHIEIKDGKADFEPLLNQLRATVKLACELNSRVESVESREVVQPESFQNALDNIRTAAQKIGSLEVNAVSLEMKIGELRDTIDELKGSDRAQEEERKFMQIREIISVCEDSIKVLKEVTDKLVKDTTTDRLTLSQVKQDVDHKAIQIEAMMDMMKTGQEMQKSADSRIKKSIALFQSSANETSRKVADIQQMIAKHDKQLEEVFQMEQRLKTMPAALNPPTTPQFLPPPPPTEVALKEEDMMITKGSTMAMPEDDFPVNISASGNRGNITDIATSPLPSAYLEERPRAESKRSSLPKLKPEKKAESRIDQRKFEDVSQKVLSMDTSTNLLKSAIDQLNKQSRSLQESKADKDQLQSLFEQFRTALAELNNRLGAVRRQVATKVDMADIEQLRKDLNRAVQAEGETAAGVETQTVRCLLCGQLRKSVARGDYPQAQQQTYEKYEKPKGPGGPNASQTISGTDGEYLVYGENGEMYYGRTTEKPRIVPEGPIVPEDEEPPLLPNI